MLQQGTLQQPGKFSPANINVCSILLSKLFVPQFDTQTEILYNDLHPRWSCSQY